ncbi:hypothetical protein [Clostridium ganghwense]|uniref:Uncharacterized protein n=1 Tax=Clostridium ganghwense TaxID=312089 RepID=A0ABT4CPT3_9CLOT|nr:hypothetical protein [Clostridium ganghwense]MCY6371059.1 hypothetical protein [Clostridium ganghwense]
MINDITKWLKDTNISRYYELLEKEERAINSKINRLKEIKSNILEQKNGLNGIKDFKNNYNTEELIINGIKKNS